MESSVLLSLSASCFIQCLRKIAPKHEVKQINIKLTSKYNETRIKRLSGQKYIVVILFLSLFI